MSRPYRPRKGKPHGLNEKSGGKSNLFGNDYGEYRFLKFTMVIWIVIFMIALIAFLTGIIEF